LSRIENLEIKYLPSYSDQEAKSLFKKGWTYSNIYSLRELRDIYIILSKVKNKNLKNIYSEVVDEIDSDTKKWEERRVLEFLNALVNFKLVDANYEYLKIVFENSIINTTITNEEKEIFKEIFFSYFRFKEISLWFINPDASFHKNLNLINAENLINDSKPLFYFSHRNRFTDSFLSSLSENNYLYIIDDKKSHLMRFWDVYISWGTSLGIIERFSLAKIDTQQPENILISIAYFINQFASFNLLDYILNNTNFNSREIFIPNLIFSIAKDFRYSVDSIKNFIINE